VARRPAARAHSAGGSVHSAVVSTPGRACSQRRRERSQRTGVLGSVMIAVRRRQREIKGDAIFHHVRRSDVSRSAVCVPTSLIDAEGQEVCSLILCHPFRISQSTKRFTPRQLLLSPSALRTRHSPLPRSPALCCPSARKRWSVLFVHVVRAPRLGSPTSGRERVISALSRRHHVPLSIHQRRRPPTRPPTRPPIRRPRPSPELPYARRPPWPVYGEPPKPRSLSWP
jgi:hypothetical protein